MPSDSIVILASAGSGKTTTIVEQAGTNEDERSLLVTYTINGKTELSDKGYERFGFIPPQVKITTWYSFVLEHFVRPFQLHLHPTRVSTINFERGRSARGVRKTNVGGYYFSSPERLRLDKVTDFACTLIAETDGLPIQRFKAICDHLYIDEVQDLSGYDLELLELLLKAGQKITFVGDCRQATYTTNDSGKNSAYSGAHIVKKFEEWQSEGLLNITHQDHSYRCIQAICDFADAIYPDFKNTKSLNNTTTDHDGIYAVRKADEDSYRQKFSPQPLRYSRATRGIEGDPMNFGAVKGLTFERTIIYPHGKLKSYLTTGDLKHVAKSLAKTYVAITRARQSVAFVVPNNTKQLIVPFYER